MNFRELFLHRLLGRPYRLNVVDHGGKGPTIIFLHGIASSLSNWDHLIPLLKDDYRCVTMDLLGFGNSAKPQWADYSMQIHIDSIHKTVQGLRLKKPYIIVGHSMGSLLAARYATLHPNKVRQLALLSPPIYIEPNKLTDKRAKRRTTAYLSAYKFLRTHRRLTPKNISLLARILPLPKSIVLNEETWIPFVRSLEQCIENQTFVEDISSIKLEVDVFYGTFDQFIVQRNMKVLDDMKHVTVHQLRVDHSVGRRFAKAVAKKLMTTR